MIRLTWPDIAGRFDLTVFSIHPTDSTYGLLNDIKILKYDASLLSELLL